MQINIHNSRREK